MSSKSGLDTKTTVIDELVRILINNVNNEHDRIMKEMYIGTATGEQLDKLMESNGLDPRCDHEWVTWTGLHGTVTDCTKCKATLTAGSP
jgi:hypothetical protein